jgi:hypothetical protein
MSHRRKKFLSGGLAGMLCSTALFGITAAHADGKNSLHLPGMRRICLKLRTIPLRVCFPSCRPSPRRPTPDVIRPRRWGKKVGSLMHWII